VLGEGEKHSLHSLANNKTVELQTHTYSYFKPPKTNFIAPTPPPQPIVPHYMSRSSYTFPSYTSTLFHIRVTFPEFMCQNHNFLFTAISVSFIVYKWIS